MSYGFAILLLLLLRTQPKAMEKTTAEHIMKRMPEQFTRRQLLEAVIAAGYSVSAGDKTIESALLSGEIGRLARGIYTKTEQEELAQ